MTADEAAEFIALWAQGLSQDAIAQRLGIPIGTVKSRVHTLAHAGKLTPMPRGGAYPRQRAKAQQGGGTGEGVSGQTPGMSPQTPRVSTGVSPRKPRHNIIYLRGE
jgi:hypothetical protein